MAMNRAQFQAGLSMPEFIARYGMEGQCAEALAVYRWPAGFLPPGVRRRGPQHFDLRAILGRFAHAAVAAASWAERTITLAEVHR